MAKQSKPVLEAKRKLRKALDLQNRDLNVGRAVGMGSRVALTPFMPKRVRVPGTGIDITPLDIGAVVILAGGNGVQSAVGRLPLLNKDRVRGFGEGVVAAAVMQEGAPELTRLGAAAAKYIPGLTNNAAPALGNASQPAPTTMPNAPTVTQGPTVTQAPAQTQTQTQTGGNNGGNNGGDIPGIITEGIEAVAEVLEGFGISLNQDGGELLTA